ncbi:hypothetical protein KC335_g7 [Hortaea werneckii]|nr:hypothetical protein KC335_g7 [Hortaea werneckii]
MRLIMVSIPVRSVAVIAKLVSCIDVTHHPRCQHVDEYRRDSHFTPILPQPSLVSDLCCMGLLLCRTAGWRSFLCGLSGTTVLLLCFSSSSSGHSSLNFAPPSRPASPRADLRSRPTSSLSYRLPCFRCADGTSQW